MTMITEWPRVTVIVLNYNGQQHLKTCFRSLYALDYPADRLELMLADNASADGSVEFMRARFPEVTLVRNDHNYGFSKANNIAAQHATGEYVAFLNNDMRVDPAWLTELMRPILRDPDVVCAGSRILSWDGQRIDFAGAVLNFYGHAWQIGYGSTHLDDYAADRPILAACGGAMVVNRAVFLDAGGFDEDYFAYFEDTDLGWRLWVLGYQVMLAAQSIVYHVQHGFWKGEPSDKKLILYERNALCSIVKNYEEENLQRILPAALLLFLHRAYLYALREIDPAPYRVEPAGAAPILHTSPVAAPVYDTRYYLRRAWTTLRQEGPRALVGRVQAEWGRRRAGPGTWHSGRRWSVHRSPAGNERLHPLTVSHLIAGNDFVRLVPRMLEKRARVQAARRRPDAEIFQLFGAPFQANYADANYEHTQMELARLFGITDLFNF